MSSRPLLCSSLHPRWLPLAAACLLGASSASAALITVSGSLTATSAAGSSIVVGDVFDYSFTFDDATRDSNGSTSNAQFALGVSAVSLQRRGGAGTWTPARGTLTPINYDVNANGDGITLQAQGTGFDPINGVAFLDIGLAFNWSGARNFVDNGGTPGETFAQVVGVSPLNFATAVSVFAEIRDANYSSPTFTMTVNGGGGGASVPEGAVFAPLALGLGALLAGRGRRR
jgi:hypothetical protein